MFAIDGAARCAACVTVTAAQALWSKRILSGAAFLGVLAGAGLTVQIHEWSISWLNLCVSSAGPREVNGPQPDLVLAFTLYPVTASAGQIAVLTAALAALTGFRFLVVCHHARATPSYLTAHRGVPARLRRSGALTGRYLES